MLEGWVDATQWLVEKHITGMLFTAGKNFVNLFRITENGQTQFSDSIDAKVAQVEMSKELERKLINMGKMSRSQVDLAQDDIKKKMYAIRVILLSIIEKDEDGNFYLTKEESYFESVGKTMDVKIKKHFKGNMVPINKVCFDIVAYKNRKSENGETKKIDFWKKSIKSKILIDPETMNREIWFTWNKVDM